ncbi:hypothetical protein F5X96DRAFT_654901 [Biscogniauxia mediterranea]|nr:hypothetical protein F5X96DRAFT_654901 [Biscogniauxia mediterranea]
MARGKRGGRPKGPPPPHLRQRTTPKNNGNPVFHGYTLAEEARNTAQKRRGFAGNDPKLRYKPVTFISAGFMDPLKDFEVPQQASTHLPTVTKDTERRAEDNTKGVENDPITTHLERPVSKGLDSEVLADATNHKSPNVYDQHKDGESDPSEDSSEEVILFKGRNGLRQQSPRDTTTKKEGDEANSMKLYEMTLELKVAEKTIHNAPPRKPSAEPADFIPFNHHRSRSRRSSRKPKHSEKEEEEAAIIADYIANMQNDGDEDGEEEDEDEHPGIGTHAFHVLRDLGGTDSEAVPDPNSSEDDQEGGSEDEFEHKHQLESEDEHMARMLAKQEELGLGSDDLMLFDGVGSNDDWYTTTEAAPRRKKGASKKARILQKKDQYPSATQMADAFDELDLMDWHRPSLNNFKRGPQSFDVSDSELEEAMNLTWKKDRLKKAEKKKAREELRSQGLLGKNVKPDDLRIKYQGGMSLDDLANEMEAFMLGSQEQLILPPFDKAARKIVHSVANRFKIKSQSAGKGIGRYPVLYRTKATLPFDQVAFDRTFSHIKQVWFPRVDVDEQVVNETRVLKRAEARNGKTRFKDSHTLRDGDIVGQHATELGAENKGRAMLEKMGWSKGMSLGSEENKGIIVPITHVVKIRKTGLGDA